MPNPGSAPKAAAPLAEPGRGLRAPRQDVCAPPLCLWDSQPPEAGEAGRGQGRSGHVWLEAVRGHPHLTGSEAAISSWEVRERVQPACYEQLEVARP